jgi:hypothetical protein
MPFFQRLVQETKVYGQNVTPLRLFSILL